MDKRMVAALSRKVSPIALIVWFVAWITAIAVATQMSDPPQWITLTAIILSIPWYLLVFYMGMLFVILAGELAQAILSKLEKFWNTYLGT